MPTICDYALLKQRRNAQKKYCKKRITNDWQIDYHIIAHLEDAEEKKPIHLIGPGLLSVKWSGCFCCSVFVEMK